MLRENDLIFAKIRPDAIIPSKKAEDAGYDVYANFEEDFLLIPPHSTVLVPTGIASAMSSKYYLNVAERGSTGSIGMKYSAGIIDSGYRGEIKIAISNINSTDILISKLTKEELIEKYGKVDCVDNSIVMDVKGYHVWLKDEGEYYGANYLNAEAIIYPYSKAIAQLIVHEVPVMDVKEITYEELKAIPSDRGAGGFGSSGK